MLPRTCSSIVLVLLSIGFLPTAVLAADPVPPVPVAITMNSTSNPVSGLPFSFEPVYPDGLVIPDNAICQYELRWGDDDSLLRNAWNETFGSVTLRGTKAAGYCDGWEFTLPYSVAGQWQWDYTIVDVESNPLITAILPGDVGFPMFTGTNEAPEWWGITESTIPGVWLSMTRHATIGSTIEVVAHPFGGYTMPVGGAQWAAYAPGDDSETHVADGHSLTFSFIPLTGGNWSSFYNDSGDPNFAGAGVDPEVGPSIPAPTPAPSVPPAPIVPAEAAAPTTRPTVTLPPTDAVAASNLTPAAPSQLLNLMLPLVAGLLVTSAVWLRRRSM